MKRRLRTSLPLRKTLLPVVLRPLVDPKISQLLYPLDLLKFRHSHNQTFMSPDDSTVLFRAIPTSFKLSSQEKRLLTEFAGMLSSEVASGGSFTCLITSDAALRRLNKQFLQQDYATDVLSFPSEQPGSLGELAISIERADAQAQELGHSTIEELKVLMLHGLLHLTGMDHETDSGAMAKAETKWQKHFTLPATLIERVQQWV